MTPSLYTHTSHNERNNTHPLSLSYTYPHIPTLTHSLFPHPPTLTLTLSLLNPPFPPQVLQDDWARLLRSLQHDTGFLSGQGVMDYSLLVGVDRHRQQLVCGAIDYVRQYTWDKQLETWVKSSGMFFCFFWVFGGWRMECCMGAVCGCGCVCIMRGTVYVCV